VIVLAAAVTFGLASLSGSAVRAHAGSAAASPVATGSVSLPAPAAGIAIPRPVVLADARGETRWAPVIRATVARARPTVSSRAITVVPVRTPEGTANLVDASAEVTRGGVSWVRASLAVLPDGTPGWLPRSALGGWSFVDTRVVIDRRRERLTLFRGSRAIFRAPVGVGTAANPTPAGTFYIRDRLTRFASPTYGPLAFGTSARAPYLTDWPDGGYIGIHGTDQPQLIPGRISHGCIRLTNAAIVALGRLMPVGTPVKIL
jgi:lipoprotein-anchoring transpeptidase ErfK/SrfK